MIPLISLLALATLPAATVRLYPRIENQRKRWQHYRFFFPKEGTVETQPLSLITLAGLGG